MTEHLLKIILTWVSVLIFVEAVVEILVASDLFIGMRAWLSKINPGFLGKLFSCGYCLSVWVSTIAILLPGNPLGIWYDHWIVQIADGILRILIMHRLSNLTHELFQRWLDRQMISVTINRQEAERETIIEVEDNEQSTGME